MRKVFFMEYRTYGNEDMFEAYERLGTEVFRYTPGEYGGETDLTLRDPDYESALSEAISTFSPDYVFSFNYQPVVSAVCETLHTPYVSWVYDNPVVLLYNYTLANQCNRIFIFDSSQADEFISGGIKNVHYLPLAANTNRLERMTGSGNIPRRELLPNGDISFIGAMYTEAHNFYDRMSSLPDYARGYLEAIMAAQHNIYGADIITGLLSDDIMDAMEAELHIKPSPTGTEQRSYRYSNYVLARKLTGMERTEYIEGLAKHYKVDLYTKETELSLYGVLNHGPVDYYDTAPYIYNLSKINLNISLRSIHNGIPLRAFDIMGAGGFLLTNYQSDFEGIFDSGVHYDYYDSFNSLMERTEYYLSHEAERREIAAQGHNEVKSRHTYIHRIREMEEFL
ncbi:MAG: glycosyltransferase [Lachnospiraceae bacterium]|nr:glycosyltransferase [Lachnospiraceae bacterium]